MTLKLLAATYRLLARSIMFPVHALNRCLLVFLASQATRELSTIRPQCLRLRILETACFMGTLCFFYLGALYES